MTVKLSNIKSKKKNENEPSPLHQLVYISQAVKAFSTDELMTILKTAHKFNQQSNISGALFYNQDLFFQVIEGEKNTLNVLFFNHIKKDTRHTHIHCFLERPIEKRTFPHWNMAFYGKNNNTIMNFCEFNDDEIKSIETFFQNKITQHFKELVDYFKLTKTN